MGNPCSTVLIQTPCYELADDRLEPPLGLLYLATWLRHHGYPVQVVDLSSVPESALAEAIPPADVYGFSTYTATYYRALSVLQLVKRIQPQATTVAGGPHASALPDIAARDFDFVIVGEGEIALLHLLQALRRGEPMPRIIREPPIADLDTLPFPDYSLVDVHSYHRVVDGRPSLSILSSRGCPYRCVFCNSIIMAGHHPPRFRSPINVIEEVRQLKLSWGVTAFRFQDDIFTTNLPRLRKLTALLQAEDITYRCFARVDRCNQEVADRLYASGCRHLAFGIESGSSIILQRMQKDQTVDDIRRGIANAKHAGLIVRVYLMVGFPGETWETVQNTINLMLDCGPDEFAVYPLIPYPGTPLYQRPQAFGITSIDPDLSRYFQVQSGRNTGYVFRTADLNESEIADMRTYMIERLEPVITWAGESKGFK